MNKPPSLREIREALASIGGPARPAEVSALLGGEDESADWRRAVATAIAMMARREAGVTRLDDGTYVADPAYKPNYRPKAKRPKHEDAGDQDQEIKIMHQQPAQPKQPAKPAPMPPRELATRVAAAGLALWPGPLAQAPTSLVAMAGCAIDRESHPAMQLDDAELAKRVAMLLMGLWPDPLAAVPQDLRRLCDLAIGGA